MSEPSSFKKLGELFDKIDISYEKFTSRFPQFVPKISYNPSPKLIGCISFYNEKNHILQCLKSIYDVCDMVVLIDGAYEKFPHKNPWSMDGTLKRIKTFKADEDPEDKILLVRCNRAWKTEMEKRTMFFSFGTVGDWYLIVDADEELSCNAYGMAKVRKLIFEKLPSNIVQVGVQCVPDPNYVGGWTAALQRHVDGVIYRWNHYTFYNCLTGYIFGNNFRHKYTHQFYYKIEKQIPFKLNHHQQNVKRQQMKEEYYKRVKEDERYDWWNFL